MTLLSLQAVNTRSAVLSLLAVWALALPAIASEQPTEAPPAVGAPQIDEAAPPAPVFPDPVLMQRARTYRTVGATLSITGAVAFVASFNHTLAALRSDSPYAMFVEPVLFQCIGLLPEIVELPLAGDGGRVPRNPRVRNATTKIPRNTLWNSGR